MMRRLMDWLLPDAAFVDFAFVPGCRCWRCAPLAVHAPLARVTGAAQ